MNTLMSIQTFADLSALRARLNNDTEVGGKLANVMVPWRGDEIGVRSALYYVGISTLGDNAESESWSMDDCMSQTETSLNMRNTEYFRILDDLCIGLFGCPRHDSLKRIGYSNLFKVHVVDSWNPLEWPKSVRELQTAPAMSALREELSALKECLVYVGSDKGYGVFPEAADFSDADFKQEGSELASVRWKWDPARRNLFIWAYHAGYLARQGAEMRNRHTAFVVDLAKRHGLGQS